MYYICDGSSCKYSMYTVVDFFGVGLHYTMRTKNERSNRLVVKYVADFYFVNILWYNNKKVLGKTSVKSIEKHNDGKKKSI